MSSTTAILVLTLGILVGAGAFVFSSYRAELAKARARVAAGGRIIPTPLGLIQYAESGHGVPLLSIHGAGGGYDQGLAIAADLVGDDYRIIAPSRFGYLDTPVPAETTDAAQADAHAALLDALKIDTAIVMGTSAGARSAIELALRHAGRVSALVLVVPGTYSPTSPVMVEGSRGSRLAFWLVNAGADFAWWSLEILAPSVLVRFLGVSPALLATASENDKARVMSTVESVQPLSQRFRGINLDSVTSLHRLPLEAIQVPTLILTTRDDLFNTLPAAQHVARSIPVAKIAVFETGGHLMVGRETQVRRAIAEFIGGADVSQKQR